MNHLWEEISEQEKVKKILQNIYQSRRVPHAFLFFGKEGTGKFFTALQFAKILNTKEDDAHADLARKKVSLLQEPYVKLIFPLPRGKGESSDDSATEKLSKDVIENIQNEIQTKAVNPYYPIKIPDANTIKISSIREIKKFIITSIDDIPYRFVIILDAHLMNDQSQNALLKNLEEPPEDIIFILITSRKEDLLPTIQSRCWNIDFEPLSVKSVSDILVKYFDVERKTAEDVANYSEGSVIKAMEFIQQDFKKILEKTISILRYSLGKKYNLAYQEILGFFSDSNDKSIKLLVQMMKNWLTDTVRNKHDIDDIYFKDYPDTLEKFNMRFSGSDTLRIFKALDNLEVFQTLNINLNVACLNLIFELASLSIRK
jgi:DNA polymerase III subunit delta'